MANLERYLIETMRLIETDKRILEHLFSDARHSTHAIAAALRLKQPSVHDRIKRLEQAGFIRQYDTLLATHMLPLIHKMYYCSLRPDSISTLRRLTCCTGIQEIFGEYTHQLFMFYRNEDELRDVEKILPSKRLEQHITLSRRLYGSIFDIPCRPSSFVKREQHLVLEPLDVSIMLQMVQGGARKTLTAIAREIGTTLSIVKYRRKKLIEAGYFLSFIAQPGEAFSSIKIAYHVFSLNGAAPLTLLAKLPRCIVAYAGEQSLTVIQLSLFFDDYLVHSSNLLRTLEGYFCSVQSFIVCRPIFLNRYRAALFS